MPEKQSPRFVSRAALAGRRAATINEADRSVEFIAATEDPVEVWDWDTWGPLGEILLMSGRVDPPSAQVPLLDTHSNWSVNSQLGSFRDIRTEGPNTVGRVCVSASREDVWTMLREGHLTDCSVGYVIREYDSLREGETKDYNGRSLTGPCRVVTSWELKELSLCPIGADPGAKARADKMKEDLMKKNKGRMEATPEEQTDLEEEIQTVIEEVAAGEVTVAEAEAEVAAAIEEAVDEETAEDGSREEDEEKKEERAKRSAALAERKRVQDIEAMCRASAMPEAYRQAFINRGLTVEQARKVIFNKMVKRGQKSGPSFYGDVAVLNDEGQNFNRRAVDSILLRGGLKLKDPVPGARELQGYSLRDLAKECLRRSGRSIPANPVDMVGRAMSTTDLPALLVEGSNRFLLEGFEEAQETWPLFTGEGSVNDFREVKLIGVGLDNTLEEVEEHDEYTYTRMAEESESVKVITYGRLFSITRQAIINDDLGALTDVPRELGAGVSRTIGDAVFSVIISNSAMSDGNPLFSANHHNLVSGGGVPDVTKLSAAIQAMKLQRDLVNKRLNIRPQYYLAPVSLEAASETFFNSEYVGTQALPTTRNIYEGQFNRIYDPRLDDDNIDDWYLIGPPQRGIRVFYLNGVKEPYLETENGFSIDAIRHKVRMDVAAAAVSWRTLVKSEA